MPEDTYNLKEQLLKASIFSPDSNECSQQEQSLSRYFEKEYKHYLKDPVSLQSIGISSELGPIMEETDDLMQQHYDENIDLFNGFLDTSYHAYTMAYYGENGDSDITLEQAQYDKFQLFVERAQIKGDENILNIGCGFGSLETFLLKEYPDIKITGITPSQTQIRYLQEKIQENGHPLSNNFSLIEGPSRSDAALHEAVDAAALFRIRGELGKDQSQRQKIQDADRKPGGDSGQAHFHQIVDHIAQTESGHHDQHRDGDDGHLGGFGLAHSHSLSVAEKMLELLTQIRNSIIHESNIFARVYPLRFIPRRYTQPISGNDVTNRPLN